MPTASYFGPVGVTISIVVYFVMAYEVELLPPAVEFLRGIDTKLRAKAARTIELLRQFGPTLPMPHAKKLSGYPLWELRVKQGSNIVRMFYFAIGGTTYVVTSGFSKKSDRTNRTEIERAMRLRAAVLEERDEQR